MTSWTAWQQQKHQDTRVCVVHTTFYNSLNKHFADNSLYGRVYVITAMAGVRR